MAYYLVEHPNQTTPQFGWQRTRVSGVIGVHTAENNTCFNGPDGGAEAVAGFIGTRADYGSYHVLADADSIIDLVHPSWAAWADTTNNPHAMSVSAAVQASKWLAMSDKSRIAVTVNLAFGAARMVQEAIAYGLLATPTPARRITAAEAISGSKAGFYGHGETNPGTRYDPGADFDWDLFLSSYQAAITGSAAIGFQNDTITPITEEDDMPYTPEQIKQFAHEGALRALETDVDTTLNGKASVLDMVRIFDQSRLDTIRGAAEAAARIIFTTEFERKGSSYPNGGGKTSFGGQLAYGDDKHNTIAAKIGAALAPSATTGLDPAALKGSIESGVRAALDGVSVPATISLGNAKQAVVDAGGNPAVEGPK